MFEGYDTEPRQPRTMSQQEEENDTGAPAAKKAPGEEREEDIVIEEQEEARRRGLMSMLSHANAAAAAGAAGGAGPGCSVSGIANMDAGFMNVSAAPNTYQFQMQQGVPQGMQQQQQQPHDSFLSGMQHPNPVFPLDPPGVMSNEAVGLPGGVPPDDSDMVQQGDDAHLKKRKRGARGKDKRERQPKRCGVCGQVGCRGSGRAGKESCPQYRAPPVEDSKRRGKRKPKRCGVCGEIGCKGSGRAGKAACPQFEDASPLPISAAPAPPVKKAVVAKTKSKKKRVAEAAPVKQKRRAKQCSVCGRTGCRGTGRAGKESCPKFLPGA